MVSNISDRSSPASLRRTHRALVLSRVQAQPGISRSELAQSLGFSDMAATRIIRDLLAAGLVQEMDVTGQATPPARKRLGRPKIGLQVVGDGLFGAGITVSAYHSEMSVCDANGVLRARRRIAYFVGDDMAEIARYYGTALVGLIEESGIDPDRIVGVGVALAARTSLNKGEIVASDYFGWGADGGEFCRVLRDIIGLPVEIDNISNALAIAEMKFGVARGVSDFVLIHVATMIGAATITEERLIRGKNGVSGMIGHFRAGKAGLRCVCGRDDCLNLSATGFGLLSRIGRIAGPVFDRSRLEEYAAALLEAVEDPCNAAHIAGAGRNLAPAFDNICKLLGPEMVILSGYLGTNDHFIAGLNAAIRDDLSGNSGAPAPVVRGTMVPTQAAALLALHIFGYSDTLDFDRFASDATTTPATGKG